MIQTAVVALLLIAGALIVQANLPVLHAQVPLTVPGLEGVQVTYLLVGGAVGAALALVWLAGMADLLVVHRQIRHRDVLLHSLEQELLRMKSAAYDQQQPVLGDIKVRLEALTLEIRNLMGRVDPVASIRSTRTTRDEAITTPAPR